jgi:GNAT superfamily N-acetyltransferase
MQIIPYTSQYFDEVARLMKTLQEHLVSIDPLKSLKTTPDGGLQYTNDLLERVKNNWIVLLAEIEEKIVWVIAWTIREQTPIEKLTDQEKKIGDIIELIVTPDARWTGIWTLLMEEMEDYFRSNGCNWLSVECFAPNISAHNFYEKHGYGDRSVYMTKSI